MAKRPGDPAELIRQFGPHRLSGGQRLEPPSSPTGSSRRTAASAASSAASSSRCKDNAVIGFEPWEDFPFNRGMLCPKGVKRYLQGTHPDRLLTALRRDPSSPAGFRPMPYDEAIRTVAAEIDRIQKAHGPDAFGVLGGASLTNEKTYLIGKFARVCLQDRRHRLQRPALHGQRRGRQQEGVRHRPHDQPLVRHPRRRGGLGRRVQRRRVLADHHQLHLAGPRAWGQGHRAGPPDHPDRPHLRPVPPGQARPRRGPLRRRAAPDDRARLARPRLHRRPHRRLRRSRRIRAASGPPRKTAEVTGVAERSIRQAAELWGTAQTSFMLHARGHRAPQPTACRTSSARSTSCSPPAGSASPGCGYATITGQANGQGGREHGQKCDQLPGSRDIANPEHRDYIAGVWGVDEDDIPGAGRRRLRDLPQDRRRRDQGPAVDLLQPRRSRSRTTPSSRGCLDKLEFYAAIDFFLNETAHHADVVLPGSCTRRTRAPSPRSRAASSRSTRPSTAPARPGGTGDPPGHRRAPSAARTASRSTPPARSSRSSASPAGAASPTTPGITYEKIEHQFGVFWPCPAHDYRTGDPTPDHPGTPRLFEPGSYNPVAKGAGPFYFPDGKARFNVADYRTPADDVDDEYPYFLTTGRVVSQFLSGTQTRRIGPLVVHGIDLIRLGHGNQTPHLACTGN